MSGYRVPRSRAHTMHQAHRDEIMALLEPLLFDPPSHTRAEETRRPLEEGFAAIMEQREACAVASGTMALFIALRACGVGPGDEVITVANSDISTTGAISHCGAVPVLCDVLESDYTIDPDLVEALVTPRTRAIVPVALHGHPADTRRLRAIADRHALKIVEDAALAAGARDHARPVGAFADAAIFSFAVFKPLGSVGNGGMIVTSDPQVATRMRSLAHYGYAPEVEGQKGLRQIYNAEGYNVPLDPLQAALLRVKLPYLPAWTEQRRALAQAYADGLQGTSAVIPVFRPESEPTFRSYTVRVQEPDRVLHALREAGIEAVRHYTPPIHHQAVYASGLRGADRLPVTERLANEILNLPVSPDLTLDDAAYVIEMLRAILS